MVFFIKVGDLLLLRHTLQRAEPFGVALLFFKVKSHVLFAIFELNLDAVVGVCVERQDATVC